ncbi:MAG: universal stress protein, partial [Alphaproteobacteria bacterium]|nr:universal stress protein [Alphaproteobacteria bacterium]
LMSAVRDENADLLVMGAYTRSRLRRLIFGGVTGDVLKNSPVPVLLAH